MSPSGSSPKSPQPSPGEQPFEAGAQDWIYRGVAGLTAVFLLWLVYRNQNDGAALLFLAPFIAGAVVTALRVQIVSQCR